MYELDAQASTLTFGNGVNGALLPAQSQVYVSYDVSDAEQGDVARNRGWLVAGFEGTYGVNPDPITGGASPSTFTGQRRTARLRSREEHALVSSADIKSAATELPLLEVARAWVPPAGECAPHTGIVRLIVMRCRAGGREPELAPETPRWLEAVRRRLAPRMPLGTRLVVSAPRYVEFSIVATIESEQGRDPASVRATVEATLQARLALVESGGVLPPRQPGAPVTHRDLTAWLRATDGVRRVKDVRLLDAKGMRTEKIVVPRSGLPRWSASRSTILVDRPAPGGGP
jgi:predicted phage baseplate assembly protein